MKIVSSYKTKTMKPTGRVTVTAISKERKLQRLITNELARRYPEIYAELYSEAEAFCNFDDRNPFSSVVDATDGKRARPSGNLLAHKEMKSTETRAAAKLGLIPRFYGVLQYEVQDE